MLNHLHNKKVFLAICSFLSLISIYLIFFSAKKLVNKENTNFVAVTKGKVIDVSEFLEATGNVITPNSVNIRSQVTGQIDEILFKEGDIVNKNQLLVKINSSNYEAQYQQYLGQLKKDQALLENARKDLQRYQDLWSKKAVSEQILDSQKSLVAQYEGNVKQDQGLVDNAKINLDNCLIRAPLEGKIGLKKSNVGNLVQANDTNVIAVLNQTNSLQVAFSLPEKYAAITTEKLNKQKLIIEVLDSLKEKIIAHGAVSAIDNQIDNSTGSFALKAEILSDNKLFINQFVNVRLLINKFNSALVIPESSVIYSNKGIFVYKVDQGKAILTETKINHDVQDKIIVKSGLKPDDLIVKSGLDKLVDGAKITYHDSQKTK